MKSKLLFALALLMASTLIFSCSDDDDDSGYSFKEQTLQGQIGGDDWEFKVGTAEMQENDTLWIDLYGVDDEDPCNNWNIEGDYLLFFIPAQVGVHELSFNWETGGQTVTFYDESATMNNVAVEGAVEILSIDETNGEVTGRIDAKIDGDNEVNGNFTAVYCQ